MITPDSLAGTYFSDDLFFYFSLLLMKLKKHDLKGINKDFRYWEKNVPSWRKARQNSLVLLWCYEKPMLQRIVIKTT